MTHYVSIDIEQGIKSNTMRKMPLVDVLRMTLMNAPEDKHDCWLISNGYSNNGGMYLRAEHCFQWIDTILIDCDNPEGNPNKLAEFEADYDIYEYVLWETASSTPERPKFRAILMLDRQLPWIIDPEKYTKKAILQLFSKYADQNASWYFTPNKAKLGTFRHHKGIPYPSGLIENLVNMNKQVVEALKPSRAGNWDIENREANKDFNPDGWRHFGTVEYCLSGLVKGERDVSLNRACYAMKARGYADKIPEFLAEVDVPMEFKKKFSRRYRG